MSWQASAWAMKKGKDYELDPVTRFVMLTLANYADPEGNDIFPSLSTLEGDTGLSERTIRRHIKTLIAVGLMEYGDQDVVRKNPKYRNDQLPKVYRFIFHRDTTGAVDFTAVGRMPTAKQEPEKSRNNDRTQSPPVKPAQTPETVDNSGNDRTHDVGTTGQTTGQRVHQTYKPSNNPYADPPPTEDEIEAGRRLREQIRLRNANRGTFAEARTA